VQSIPLKMGSKSSPVTSDERQEKDSEQGNNGTPVPAPDAYSADAEAKTSKPKFTIITKKTT